MGLERSEYRFTRATVRHYTRWGDTQLRVNLKRLEEYEYLLVRRGGPGSMFVYELHFAMDAQGKPVLAGLSGLYDEANCAGVNENCAGGVRPLRGGIAGGARGGPSPATTRGNHQNGRNHEKHSTRENEAHGGPQNPVVAVTKPNGHAAEKRAGVK
jgi:hypothetical protein